MKKEKFILFCLLITVFSCTERRKSADLDTAMHVVAHADTVKAQSAEVIDTAIHAVEKPVQDITLGDSINFEKYAVETQEAINKAPLNFASNPNANLFKTRIIEAYKSDKVDFGGYYIGCVFGCGAGCIMGFMVDVRDGRIYDLPLGEENMCFWNLDNNVCRANSKLFISSICKEEDNSKTAYYKAYVWNEDNKIFEKTNGKDFIVKKD